MKFTYWLCPWDGTPMESPSLNSDTHRCPKCKNWIDAWYPPGHAWKVVVDVAEYTAGFDQLCVDGVWYVVWRENIINTEGRWVGSKTRVWRSPC